MSGGQRLTIFRYDFGNKRVTGKAAKSIVAGVYGHIPIYPNMLFAESDSRLWVFAGILEYSATAAGFAAIVFADVPQNTASGSYSAVIRAGSRLLYAATHAAVASATCCFAVSV